MTCREIPAGKLGNAKTIEDAYRALGILRPKAGTGEQPPRLVLPEGYDAKEFNYLVGTDSQTFNVAPLYANNSEQLNCLLKSLGYNAERARQIDKDANATKDQKEYDDYLANLTPQEALTYNLYRTLEVVDYFRKDAVKGKADSGGNTDGNPDQISTKELDAWAWAVSKQNNEAFFKQGGDVVSRLHALAGLATYLATPDEPQKTPAPVPPVASGGPRVVSSSVPADAGTDAGAPKEPAGEGGGTPNPTPTDGGGVNWLTLLVGAGIGAGLVGLYRALVGRGDSSEPKHPDAKTAVRQQQLDDDGIPSRREKQPRVVNDTTEQKPAQKGDGPRVVKDTTGPAQGGGTKPAAGGATLAQPDDIATALKDIDDSKSPAGGSRLGGTPPAGDVTPENVIISGPNAEAVSGADPHVIRAQIVLTYRHFLSQTAREALLGGKELPAGGDLVNSAFTERVNVMVDAVMTEYHDMLKNKPTELAEIWKTQLEDRGYITRRGAPQRLLMSACGDFISADAARAQSPFAGGAGAEIRAEAEKRAGETDFFEKGMREILKDPVRLGR